MTSNQMRDILSAKPFLPFTIHLADGDALRVNHPELLTLSPGGRTGIVWTSDERFQIFDVLLVTELSNVEEKKSA